LSSEWQHNKFTTANIEDGKKVAYRGRKTRKKEKRDVTCAMFSVIFLFISVFSIFPSITLTSNLSYLPRDFDSHFLGVFGLSHMPIARLTTASS
jgi:hypothetical protein